MQLGLTSCVGRKPTLLQRDHHGLLHHLRGHHGLLHHLHGRHGYRGRGLRVHLPLERVVQHLQVGRYRIRLLLQCVVQCMQHLLRGHLQTYLPLVRELLTHLKNRLR